MVIDTKRKILLISLLISILLMLITVVFVQDIGTIINVGVLCMFIIVTPFFIYQYSHFLWLRSVEKEFPNFIRDIAGLKRSGMTLAEAIKMATRNSYGKLTPEIKTLSNKLSWGVPFSRAMQIFKKRFKGSRIIEEAIAVMDEAHKTGGDVSAILFSLSRDMILILDAEEERKSIVRQHMMMMYGIFFLFVGISIAIMVIMIPMMTQQRPGLPGSSEMMALSFESPCTKFYVVFPCAYFELLGEAFSVKGDIPSYYFSIFFSILLIQAIFMGLISGQIGENSVVAGIKHSLIMLASIFLLFTFLIKMGILPL